MKKLLCLCAAAAWLAGCSQTESDTAARDAQPPSGNTAATAPKPLIRNIEAEEAAQLLETNKQVLVLDVRTPAEFASGHIAGATNIDFNALDFARKLATLDKAKPYLVHCAAGGRSAKSRELMKSNQFATIYHLEGGLKAWEKAGKPVVR